VAISTKLRCLAIAALGLPAMASCLPAAPPAQLRSEDGAPHITLVRGVNGSSLAMRPPYLSGEDFSLTFRKNTLFGWVSPATAGGALRVEVKDDAAVGFGPHGAVGMDIIDEGDGTLADGLWDGQRVHLSFALSGLTGTVADVRQARPACADAAGASGSCEYTLERHTGGVDRGGVFEGFSICAGMPQRTRLEVPPSASALLSRSELVTVLVALLSAPPLTQSELPTQTQQLLQAAGFEALR
jgi:hypothetical protein